MLPAVVLPLCACWLLLVLLNRSMLLYPSREKKNVVVHALHALPPHPLHMKLTMKFTMKFINSREASF